MASLNRATIIGNVGSDPEMRFTPAGNAVANFSVAVNDKVGENDHTEWFKVVTWKKLAETCNQNVHKGMLVCVEGRMQTSDWESEDEVKHYKTELIASRVIFLSKSEQREPEPVDNIEPEDIPF